MLIEATRPYTKVARAAAEDRTHVALLDAAEQAFLVRLVGTMLARRGGRRAGVTKQTLLRHFGSKDGLLEQTYARAFERVRAQRLRAPSDDVAGAVDNLLDHYEEDGDRALRIGAMASSEPIAGLVAARRQLHYDWVDHAFGRWLARPRGRRRAHVRAALIALCDVQTWSILRRDLGLPRRDVRAALVLAIDRLLEEDT